ncbi:hypothetical protein DSM106972_032930 [Dulcicalothrix desertica PCC 7102]|uniref:Uncharacterized protein n=1 Tax=Dulcicalothrix desertica PCC 7102 TaxID=232991 RepID=A0A3S1J1J8_9CYAN|nr:hypothetical protein [Dulcicalothrix desertica]RUT06087.1 hypothetical protein DSM106972_032930 [Dulcicalothrix desertica PCC 7102]TWH54253.1 hypothetical protein CAL7102_02267 [Dulcicalothrix desertica PCC 7102]
MVAILSRGVTVPGVQAFQDSDRTTQFVYYPTTVTCIPGETLQDFKVTYWGIGKPFFMQKNNRIDSVVGAILAGRAIIDISSEQRQMLIEQIRKAYGVRNPALIPLPLQNVRVQPVIANNTLSIDKDADIKFPETIQLGTAFNYQIGTGNSLFAQFVATQGQGDKFIPNPAFGINIVGEAEFLGDPWTVEVEANLSQVWSYVRKRVSLAISLGWFKFKLGDYEKIIQDLQRDKIIKLRLVEGSLDNEKYGRYFLEMGKEIFTAINQQANSEVGFFKFEPSRDMTPSASLTLWTWDVSVNLAYGEQSLKFSQLLNYKNTISYSGRLRRLVPASMTLAVICNEKSKNLFQDLGNVTEPCITPAKADEFQKRLMAEVTKKQPLLDRIYNSYILGSISQEQYERAMLIINGLSFKETLMLTPSTQSFMSNPEEFILGLSDSQINRILEEAIKLE